MRACMHLWTCVMTLPPQTASLKLLSQCYDPLIETSPHFFIYFLSCFILPCSPCPLFTRSQLWLTPRRLRSRISVKARNSTHQLWPPKTLDCQKTQIARQQRKMGMLVLRRHQPAVQSQAPATLHLQRLQRSPLRTQHLSNHRLRLTAMCLQSCTWICTTLTRRPQRAADTF